MDDAPTMIEVDGVRIAVRDTGEGEPIVLLHGYPQNHRTWRHQLAPLATSRRVIAVDWPGWGDSERKLDLATGYDDEVGRLGRVLDKLGIDRCNLFGHDYGGFIGLGFVIAHPERVLRFAILNSRAHETFPRGTWWTTWGLGVLGRRAPGLVVRAPIGAMLRRGLAPDAVFGCFDDALIESYVGFLDQPPARRWFARFFAQYPLRARREQLSELRRSTVPTAVIWGTADPWCPLTVGEELAATIPEATLTRIDGGVHFIMEHKPAEVTAALGALLERQAGESRPAAAPTERVRSGPPPSPIMREALLAGWCWLVCACLIVLGMIGIFFEHIGPLPTNQAHALALNLGVGLVGFAFARFAQEKLFVPLIGIGMIAMAIAGFVPATRTALYAKFNMNATSSWGELIAGAISVGLWLALRKRR